MIFHVSPYPKSLKKALNYFLEGTGGSLFGFQIKCSILFGEPQAGKSPPAPHKTCGFGACLAGAMPI
ncbi:MAG: hypothetical protein LBU06_04515, partial [Desulfovibrio sp.]|nr:hypothetical protein [Desulfovibrio sp.]